MAKQAIVPSHSLQLKKRLMGGVALHYACPSCKEELATTEADVLTGETCPTCLTKLTFDEALTSQIRERFLEKERLQKLKARDKATFSEARQQEENEHVDQSQQERLVIEEKRKQRKGDQDRKKIERAQKKNQATLLQQLFFILGVLMVMISWFIPVFGLMTLVAGGLFMVCSLLSEIATHLVRLKIALQEIDPRTE
tara:strand:- start:1095 stop:1685 length:591 start_codon:yes stop_codon:yes gene_type:complete